MGIEEQIHLQDEPLNAVKPLFLANANDLPQLLPDWSANECRPAVQQLNEYRFIDNRINILIMLHFTKRLKTKTIDYQTLLAYPSFL